MSNPSTVQKRLRRHTRIRAKVSGTKDVPRLAVFKSNAHIYAQLVDDRAGATLVAASDADIKDSKKDAKEEYKQFPQVQTAFLVGKELARRAQGKNIKQVVFDRGGFIYTGRIRAVADGAREGGLQL